MKPLDSFLRKRLPKASLRVKVALAFILPMVLSISFIMYLRDEYYRRQQEIQIENTAIQVGDLAVRVLQNALLSNNQRLIAHELEDIQGYPAIQRVTLVDADGTIFVSTDPKLAGQTVSVTESGCVECHAFAPADRPRVARVYSPNGVLRVSTLIENGPECRQCHADTKTHLGILLMDSSLASVEQSIRDTRVFNILMALITILLIVILSYAMIRWLIVRRVEVLYNALSSFAGGNFSARVPKPWRTEDEITHLADHFNEIADVLERHEKEQREIAVVRQEAITEERERIARDLHDGIAQMLAYLNNKVSAVRLLLKQRHTKLADHQLAQMESVILAQSTEVRAAIIGLRVVGQGNATLFDNLKEYAVLCNRLGDLKVEFELDPRIEQVQIDPEAEVHLFRITQEAVSNVRKHASATQAHIHMWLDGNHLVLDIHDNGVGFDPWQTNLWRPPHFGLHNIGERAELIGAAFKVEAEPGQGTHICVRLDLKES